MKWVDLGKVHVGEGQRAGLHRVVDVRDEAEHVLHPRLSHLPNQAPDMSCCISIIQNNLKGFKELGIENGSGQG